MRRQPNGKACWQPYVKPPAECGTDAGYYRHRKVTHTDPCGPCKAAHAAATNTRRNRRYDVRTYHLTWAA
jgi:hypothetical protein